MGFLLAPFLCNGCLLCCATTAKYETTMDILVLADELERLLSSYAHFLAVWHHMVFMDHF